MLKAQPRQSLSLTLGGTAGQDVLIRTNFGRGRLVPPLLGAADEVSVKDGPFLDGVRANRNTYRLF